MTKTCPNCQHENPIIAPICVKCKTLLPEVPTEIVDIGDTPPHLKQLSQMASQRIESPPNTLSLLIPPEQSPLIRKFQDGDELILGRAASETATPTIDLSAFGATSLGVSRSHAVIKLSSAECSIVDLGSSNGTWVNENKLEAYKTHKLRNGDLLRLGNMLVFIYFSNRPVSTETIILSEKSQQFTEGVQYKLTPSYLEQKVIPFIKAIFDIQFQIDSLNKSQSAGPEVEEISVSEKQSGIEVKLRGAGETVNFLKTKLYSMGRQENPQNEAPVTTVIKGDTLLSITPPGQDSSKATPHKLPDGWAEHCQTFLIDVAPDVPADTRAIYYQKIAPPLGRIAASDLEIIAAENLH